MLRVESVVKPERDGMCTEDIYNQNPSGVKWCLTLSNKTSSSVIFLVRTVFEFSSLIKMFIRKTRDLDTKLN